MTEQNTGVEIIGVTNPGEDGDNDLQGFKNRQAFINRMSPPISHVLEDPGEIWLTYGVVSQPSMVFVNADGTFERNTGGLGREALLARATALSDT